MTRIFVIEDHAVVRAGLAQLLQTDSHFELAGTASNGREALNLIAEGLTFDVMLTDLYLGDMTGIELTRNVKQVIPDAKIILLTMETDERYLAEAFRAGIKGYLLKESSSDELLYGLKKISENKSFICTSLTARLTKRVINASHFTQRANTDVQLSNREAEILELLADGYTNLQIADKLFTSRRTVEGHRQSLLNKTGVRNTPELVKYAMLHGLIKLPMAG